MAPASFSIYLLEAEKKWFSETNTLKKGWLSVIIWMGIPLWVLVSIISKGFR